MDMSLVETHPSEQGQVLPHIRDLKRRGPVRLNAESSELRGVKAPRTNLASVHEQRDNIHELLIVHLINECPCNTSETI